MENLNLDKFNPTKAELLAKVEKYNSLTISGVEDKAGYEAVDKARKDLKADRVKIEKAAKEYRAEALAVQKRTIALEKEYVGLIEPLETELENKQKAIDEEKEKIKRKKLLPERHEKLKAIGLQVDDDFLLLMDDLNFSTFFNQKNTDYLAEKERLMKLEQEKIDAEKRKIEEEKLAAEREKQHQLDIENARKEEAEKAEAEANRKIREAELNRIKEEVRKAENDRLEQEKLEKQKKYQQFLRVNKYVEGEEFYIARSGSRILLYKKVGELEV